MKHCNLKTIVGKSSVYKMIANNKKTVIVGWFFAET